MADNRLKSQSRVDPQDVAIWVAVGLVVAVVALVNLAVRLGHQLAGTIIELSSNPFALVIETVTGQAPFPAAAVLIIVLLVIIIGLALSRRGAKKSRVDDSARFMGRGKEINSISKRSAQTKANRLGVQTFPGVPIGRELATGQELFGSWEDLHLDIWGPRMGKTTSRAIPAIMSAPGAVLATSNKRDLVDATIEPRKDLGRTWVFDPQNVAGAQPTWWWNPLSSVTDDVSAIKLAGHFADADTGAEPGIGSHWEHTAADLLAGFFLAASMGNNPITIVWDWVNDPESREAADLLRERFPMMSTQLLGFLHTPDKERGSIFSTARRMASCLRFEHVRPWITDSGTRDQFDPDVFVNGKNTLYSLSKEGRASASPLVMALTADVVEAGERLATRSSGGRLNTPMVVVLDEAANVCRWKDLPDLYSHYGSRGIILMTILQSWSQGVTVWGETGMKQLWSASNIKVYGGNVGEVNFLEDLSQIIGERERRITTSSTGRGGRSVSDHVQRERIMDVADLAALPQGRAVVISAGNRPALVRTMPWMDWPFEDKVKDSLRKHDPQANTTILTLQSDMAKVKQVEIDHD